MSVIPNRGTKARKWGLIALAAILVLVVGAILGFQAAVGLLKGKVLEALGPNSEVNELRVRWSAVELNGLRIKARRGWPAADTLRAERVVIVPSLRSLLSDRIQVGPITVVRPYLSALRTRDGKLQVVPSLLAGAASEEKAAAGPPARSVTISRITLEDGVVELFDATVAQPPLKIRLEKIQAAMRDVVAPALTGKSRFDFTALVKGLQRDGRATVSRWAEVASKDSAVKFQLRSVDLVMLQPYLTQATETRVQNEAFATRLATGLAENLGVSIRGVAEGVGSALQQLLGGPKKR